MKQFNKTLIAAALMVAAGSANAALVTDSTTGGNELFLAVYDSAQAKTFNLGLGVSFAQLASNAATALTAFAGAGKDLSSDANWTAFKAGITNNANVQYMLATGSEADFGVVVSGITPIAQFPDITLTTQGTATFINKHANQINLGLADGQNAVAGATNSSSLVNDLPADPVIGQLHPAGVNATDLWGGWGHNPLQAYGSAANLYLTGTHTTPMDDGLGTIVDTTVFTDADVHNLGQFNLAGNTLSFAPAAVSAVPLPAAVWMFGAGLMGLLRLNRRKSVEI